MLLEYGPVRAAQTYAHAASACLSVSFYLPCLQYLPGVISWQQPSSCQLPFSLAHDAYVRWCGCVDPVPADYGDGAFLDNSRSRSAVCYSNLPRGADLPRPYVHGQWSHADD